MKGPWRLPGGQGSEWEGLEEQNWQKRGGQSSHRKQQGQKAEKHENSLLQTFHQVLLSYEYNQVKFKMHAGIIRF